ncbi:MAG: sulfotransferase [Sphingomonas sp.]|uniref:tetratricopeptide repeat-containing sulfotransferase family protein n=1 Tax=Sphingomonas sp. TaxID=28214 RepID=UPI0017ACC573|nr:tetratricopeptide repeat-containing sulfotransferase family protein [Sphingomonas sp.]MBA3666285.1 sulfotransferase [Sphingomonas sp.]
MNTTPTLDSQTIEVIRSAVAAAAAGRTSEACDIGERGLMRGCDPVALHALIGSILLGASDFEPAVVHLQAAHEARPSDPLILKNLARAMVGCERYADALGALNHDVVALDRGGDLQRLLGFAAQMAGDLSASIDAYEQVVAAEPSDWETWNNLGNARASSGDLTSALTAIQRAVELNPYSISTRLNLARTLRDAGKVSEADAEYRRMADDFPDDPGPLAELFDLLQSLGGGGDSDAILERAVERDPADVKMLIALGRQYLLRFEDEAAERSFRRALDLEPANGDAYLGLCDLFEHYRPKSLPALIAEAQLANIDEASANLIRALVARREGRYRRGADALKDVPEDFEPIQRWHLAGQLLDGLADFDDAFNAFSRMNQALAADRTLPLQRAAEVRAQLRDQLQCMTPEWRNNWSTPPILPTAPAPVFLVGFPRSGTTLLDTILMGHPDVEVMEEKPVLHQLRAEGCGFDAIAGMSEADVRRAQERYFEIASNYAELREGSLLIDKSPLHMQSIPQIYRLFPKARFILALRHPADAVLSCFMANFRLNSAMANFLSLETSAEFYDLTFSMWEKSLSLFPVEANTVVYEKMVEDPKAAILPVVERLGLKWAPEMLDHQITAERRGLITTASYAQVTEPLYKSAVGRWERYRSQLEPILPVLRPWIEKFGYTA